MLFFTSGQRGGGPQIRTDRQTDRQEKKQAENSRLISLKATWFIRGHSLHYMLDEGAHLTLHVFLVWLFPLVPPSSPSPHHPWGEVWPCVPPLRMTLHLPVLPAVHLHPPQRVFVCICVCRYEHLSSKSSVLLNAELMIILHSAPALHKP